MSTDYYGVSAVKVGGFGETLFSNSNERERGVLCSRIGIGDSGVEVQKVILKNGSKIAHQHRVVGYSEL